LGEIENIEKFKENFKFPIFEYHKSMGVPKTLIPKLEEKYREAYTKYSCYIKIFSDVTKALEKLRKKRIKLAIASNIPSRFLDEHLDRFKIKKFFSVITGQDDSLEQKPSPEPLLITLKKLGSVPKYSAYVGDMEEDIIAGKRAKVYTVAVCREESYHFCWKLKKQKPDFLLNDLVDLPNIIQNI
jgi:pyrophosphatase PpaX